MSDRDYFPVRPVQGWVMDLMEQKVPDLTEQDREAVKRLGDFYFTAEVWLEAGEGYHSLTVWTGNERHGGTVYRSPEGKYSLSIMGRTSEEHDHLWMAAREIMKSHLEENMKSRRRRATSPD